MSQNNIKKIRYTWGSKVFIVLLLVGCNASISALAREVMEGI